MICNYDPLSFEEFNWLCQNATLLRKNNPFWIIMQALRAYYTILLRSVHCKMVAILYKILAIFC